MYMYNVQTNSVVRAKYSSAHIQRRTKHLIGYFMYRQCHSVSHKQALSEKKVQFKIC